MLERSSIFKAICIGGKKSDIFYAISDAINNNKVIKNVLIDVSRQDYNKISYSALEAISNGFFFSTKYESSMCILPNPVNICVFCNSPPDYNAMSSDRWNVINLGSSSASISSQLDVVR